MMAPLDKLRAGGPIYDSIRWNWYKVKTLDKKNAEEEDEPMK
jgi:hypothetical protein